MTTGSAVPSRFFLLRKQKSHHFIYELLADDVVELQHESECFIGVVYPISLAFADLLTAHHLDFV